MSSSFSSVLIKGLWVAGVGRCRINRIWVGTVWRGRGSPDCQDHSLLSHATTVFHPPSLPFIFDWFPSFSLQWFPKFKGKGRGLKTPVAGWHCHPEDLGPSGRFMAMVFWKPVWKIGPKYVRTVQNMSTLTDWFKFYILDFRSDSRVILGVGPVGHPDTEHPCALGGSTVSSA